MINRATSRQDIRWGVARRFEFLEWRAFWLGRVNRGDLEEHFGISKPQASTDLGLYQEVAPGNIEYDSSEKAYVPSADFQPQFLRLSADRYLMQINAIQNSAVSHVDTWFGSLPSVAVVPTVVRSVSPATLRAILRATEKGEEIDILYHSLTSTGWRGISPHSLAFDGHRWHTRAWCAKRQEFRDFVLTRIQDCGERRATTVNPTDDVEWNTLIDLEVVAHPDQTPAERSAIENDFGMENGRRLIKTRLALAFYLMRRLMLDEESDALPATRKQLLLRERDAIEPARRAAKEESRIRVLSRMGRTGTP